MTTFYILIAVISLFFVFAIFAFMEMVYKDKIEKLEMDLAYVKGSRDGLSAWSRHLEKIIQKHNLNHEIMQNRDLSDFTLEEFVSYYSTKDNK